MVRELDQHVVLTLEPIQQGRLKGLGVEVPALGVAGHQPFGHVQHPGTSKRDLWHRLQRGEHRGVTGDLGRLDKPLLLQHPIRHRPVQQRDRAVRPVLAGTRVLLGNLHRLGDDVVGDGDLVPVVRHETTAGRRQDGLGLLRGELINDEAGEPTRESGILVEGTGLGRGRCTDHRHLTAC